MFSGMHLTCMKATFLLLLLFVSSTLTAQEKGCYRYTCAVPKEEPTVIEDSLPSIGLPIVRINPAIIRAEWRDEKLVIKPFRRFKIEGSGLITTYGLNTDNPTIYGRYKKKGGTLILRCKKSIQHFNKMAPKQRVKVKMDKVYRYVIAEGKLETSEFCYWYKLKDQ